MATSDCTVFIVEDDVSVRDALALLLGVHGYRTAIFADAKSFQRAYNPDCGKACLLLDIRMPGMDGLTLQKRLLESGSDLPVIVMTGHGDIATAVEAMRLGAENFLTKPVELAHLEAAAAQDGQWEFFAEELRLAQEALGEITGRVSADDLLGEIFSRFCIGK